MLKEQEEENVKIPMITLPYDYVKIMFIKVFQNLVKKDIISVEEADKIIEETEQEIKKMQEEMERLTAERMKAVRERESK